MFKKLLVLLAFATLWVPLARSELFVTQKGEKGISLKYLSWDTDHFWDKKGNKEKTWSEFKRKEASLDIEYGVSGCDTLGLKAAYGHVEEELDGKRCGITEVELSWRRLIGKRGPYAYYAKIAGIIPPESGYKPSLRYGQYGLEGKLIATRNFSIGSIPVFFYGDLGYRWYSGFPSDQFRNNLHLHCCLCRWFQLVLRSELSYGVFNGKSRLDQSLVWMNPNYRLWKGEVEGVIHVMRCLDISLGYFQHLWGRNVGTGGGFMTRATLVF